jgi:hypothetical protein
MKQLYKLDFLFSLLVYMNSSELNFIEGLITEFLIKLSAVVVTDLKHK